MRRHSLFMRAFSIKAFCATIFLGIGPVGCARVSPPDPPADLVVASEIRDSLLGGATSGDAKVVAASTGTGWATLRGTFRLASGAEIPKRKPLKVDKDIGICAPGGAQVLSEELLIDPSTRGIANVVLFARKTQRVHDSAQPNDSKVLFDQEKCIFTTHVFPMLLGQTMEIKNSDPTAHNTKIDAVKGISFNQTVPAGKSLSFKPTNEENAPVAVGCSIHPWMTAYLLPRKNAYVAVTASDGSFEIPYLPDGEPIEFQVWHESASGPNHSLVGVEAPVKWNKRGRFAVTLSDGEEHALDVVVPGSSFR